MNTNDQYKIEPIGKISQGLGVMSKTLVGVFRRLPDKAGILIRDDQWEQIGEFERNYDWCGPFWAFTQDGQDYALYSRDYTATRVMRLPDCVDVAGEDGDPCGICPLDFYVPESPRDHYRYNRSPYKDEVNGQFGFVSGCPWGIESYNPILYIDLSGVKDGKFLKDGRIGDLQIHPGKTIADMVSVWQYTANYPVFFVAGSVPCRADQDFTFDPDIESSRVLKGILEALGLGDVDPEKRKLAESVVATAMERHIWRRD